MHMQKDYGDNFLSERSSTKRIHAPGGGSSMGALLGGSNYTEQKQKQKEKENISSSQNQQIEQNQENIQKMEKPTENAVKNAVKNPSTTTEQNSSHYQSDAEKVREFTFEAGQATPDKPSLMNVDEVNFISKMIIDELLELYSTVLPPASAKNAMKKMIDSAKSIPKMNVSPNQIHEVIAEQNDAFVDIWYYSLNAACKKGVNLSRIFDLVHNANMAKRDPVTGKFLKRADGKIIKPKGWKPPNVTQEIKHQMNDGSW